MSYPSAITSFTTINNGDTSDASQIDPVYTEITALETAMLNGFQHNLSPLSDNSKSLGDATHGWTKLFLSTGGQVIQGGTNPWTGYSRITITDTGSVNNYAPAGISGHTVIRCNNASDLTITGLAGGYDTQIVIFERVGAGNVFFAHASGSSSAANQFNNIATSGNTPISAGGFAMFQYDGVASVWRLVAHEQGGWVTQAQAGVTFTPVGGGTWTVDNPGDYIANKYRLVGRSLKWMLSLDTTTIAGTVSSVTITHPSTFTNANIDANPCLVFDNSGSVASIARCSHTAANGSTVSVALGSGSNFQASTNLTYFRLMVEFEVQ